MVNEEANKQRLVNLSNASKNEFITKAENKNTKESTKWADRVFLEGKFYCCKEDYGKFN